MEPCQFVSKFSVSFSWDFEEDWSVRDIQGAVFNVIEDGDSRSQEQIVCSSVQNSGVGVLLAQPHPETDVIACEMHFKAHSVTTECCITKIVVVSDAKNLELFVDDMYEKTTKGCMLTLKKGKKAPLFESEFDLSSHVQGNHKMTIKFVTGEKKTVKLHSVIVKVAHCPSNMPPLNDKRVDMGNVRKMLEDMGVTPPPGAQKMMQEIERQQEAQTRQLQDIMTSAAARALPRSGKVDIVRSSQLDSLADDNQSALAAAILNNEDWKRRSAGNSNDLVGQARRSTVSAASRLQQRRPASMPPPGTRRGTQDDMADLLTAYLQRQQQHQSDRQSDSNETVIERTVVPVDPFARSSTPGNNRLGPSARSSFRLSSGFRNDLPSAQSSRPSSLSFSDTLERAVYRVLNEPEASHAPPAAERLPIDKKRCQECGCPGCLTVYDSITTNVFAAEQRIMGKVDLKMQELLSHIDTRFDALYDALLARQEYLTSILTNGIPNQNAFRHQGN